MIGGYFVSDILIYIQFVFTIIVGIYFFTLLKTQQTTKTSIGKESKKELEKLKKLRAIHLSEPLSEKTRPSSFDEIIGQNDGLKALKAALCGPNPQHVIIYGPPGVGKTAAARVALEEAKKIAISPFKEDAKFIEMDATTLRFDERGIADPLIGSVHDPIYQGAGAYGSAGIPQPKPGAVTKAHGGVLFIDEIGELHPIQMNKLLKVLEDRKVFLESAYYSSEDSNIPSHIHDIFQNGLPADFRLIGATTRTPEEIPPALRSRCTEIFFQPLTKDDVGKIVKNAAKKGAFALEEGVAELITQYASNGRDAVNIVQTAGCIATIENRKEITVKDVEWVIEFGQYSKRPDKKISSEKAVGCVNGLAVYGVRMGALLEIEVIAEPAEEKSKGIVTVTGIIEEEEFNKSNGKMKRRSTAKGSIDNVLTAMKNILNVNYKDYDIHINFPGGMPVDGPSAGIAIFTAVYSAILKKPVSNKIAMTGEISIRGNVHPVGGVHAKINAAISAGIEEVLIPADNWQETFEDYNIKVIPVKNIDEVLKEVFKEAKDELVSKPDTSKVLTAQGI
ncbi:MAG: ATP-dependent Lon protease [Epulopiscium sp.]|jgi:Lon-like ATP-dependent protease|uniref:endopeptidase La n=1 Tax=Defluviitalea raffinosedens TaxID=1450156 RepID=A0A7C8LDA3_9FIRM|nr:ATP-dependent protease LonB [Defluviitalea raffinosedens]MBZ4669647.1 lon4 [Defluviitaleaceae bacterium]MDK2787476.1 ATP-dependent Lon protease [Candidatus Epulonipiscium sp.]HHW67049.1 ATP-dependent protease LonB [Candidatus Epulonipiscium sp.]